MIKNKKTFAIIIITVSMLASTLSFYFWQVAKSPNLNVEGKEKVSLYIPTGATYQQIVDSLNAKKLINDKVAFGALAKWMKIPSNFKPGRYFVQPNMGNRDLLSKIRLGEQDPIKLTFNNVRLKDDLIKKIGSRFEFDTETVISMLKNPETCAKYGFDTTTIMAMFIPDTYLVNWNTTPEKFMDRMKGEYDKFWTKERIAKAAEIGLSQVEVSVLASIVQGETNKSDERPRVAGAYMNRLKTNMALQADPTVVFAWRDFTIKRVSLAQTAIDSPYNTYRNVGLPPGPINLPDVIALDAVLNYEKHDYIYFCAKEDFSGYHNFAVTYDEHIRNAKIYQAALTKLKIMK
jgi:UPF0755 protein